jgi:gluconolactonase
MAILNNDTQVSVFVGSFGAGLDHPECIACGLDGYAYAGGEAGQIYRIDLRNRQFKEFASTGAFVGGLAQDGRRNLYACSNRAVMRIAPDGKVSIYTKGTPDEPMTSPNYPVFDKSGNLYVSDSGEWKRDNGRIYKVSPGGKATVWCRSLTQFPNGLCLSPDGNYLYVVMSLNPPRVVRVRIEPDGGAGDIETVVHLPGTVPDGLAFDTEGRLYISCYRPDRIYRLSQQGKLDILAEDYEGTAIAAPTNIAFCGEGRDIFLGANLGRWHITRYEADATGTPLNYPEVP